MVKKIVTWDLGATKCAAGLVEYDEVADTYVCKNSGSVILTQATSLEDLIAQLEVKMDFSMLDADAICIGAAGIFDGEKLIYAGAYPYEMNFAKIARENHWPPFAVVHDYTPVVCATFTPCYMNNDKNVKRLNSHPMAHHGRRIALGVGTGLGMKDGVLFANGDFWLGQNEAGHMGVATPPATDSLYLQRHAEFIRFLQSYKTKVTFETILSGPGMIRLYRFFYPNSDAKTPEEVGEKIREGQANEMLAAFSWYLGLFVGTVQLIFMPEGGVWVTGGVALHHISAFDLPDFFDGIRSSPAYLPQREKYALGVLRNPEHALIGGAYYAVKRLLHLNPKSN